MSNYSDKSDGDCNISSNNSTFTNHAINNNEQFRLNANNNNMRSRSRSLVTKSRSRSVSDRSLTPSIQNQRDQISSNGTNLALVSQDSYHNHRRHREQSPPSQTNTSRPHYNSTVSISKKRERSLSNHRYSSSSCRRRPSPPNGRRRSRSPPIITNYSAPRYSRREIRPSPPGHFNGRHHDLIDRFNPPENEILAIFGLSKRANEQDLLELYKNYGCKECKIIIDKHTGCPKGYGFVYFGRVKDAILAKKETDGKLLLNKPMRVDFSIGERDFNNQTAPLSVNHYTSQYAKSNGYIDDNNNRSSSRYYSSSQQQADYYRRDQRPPLPSRELMSNSSRHHEHHFRERSPIQPQHRHHMNRYTSPPLTPPSASQSNSRYQNGFYNKNDERNRRMSPIPPQMRNIYRRSPLPPPLPPRSRSRSRSIDRHRRYNNDHLPMNLDYLSFRNSGNNNNASSVPTRYNDEMINHHNRRSNRIV